MKGVSMCAMKRSGFGGTASGQCLSHPIFTNRPAAVIKSSAARFSAALVFHFSEEAA